MPTSSYIRNNDYTPLSLARPYNTPYASVLKELQSHEMHFQAGLTSLKSRYDQALGLQTLTSENSARKESYLKEIEKKAASVGGSDLSIADNVTSNLKIFDSVFSDSDIMGEHGTIGEIDREISVALDSRTQAGGVNYNKTSMELLNQGKMLFGTYNQKDTWKKVRGLGLKYNPYFDENKENTNIKATLTGDKTEQDQIYGNYIGKTINENITFDRTFQHVQANMSDKHRQAISERNLLTVLKGINSGNTELLKQNTNVLISGMYDRVDAQYEAEVNKLSIEKTRLEALGTDDAKERISAIDNRVKEYGAAREKIKEQKAQADVSGLKFEPDSLLGDIQIINGRLNDYEISEFARSLTRTNETFRILPNTAALQAAKIAADNNAAGNNTAAKKDKKDGDGDGDGFVSTTSTSSVTSDASSKDNSFAEIGQKTQSIVTSDGKYIPGTYKDKANFERYGGYADMMMGTGTMGRLGSITKDATKSKYTIGQLFEDGGLLNDLPSVTKNMMKDAVKYVYADNKEMLKQLEDGTMSAVTFQGAIISAMSDPKLHNKVRTDYIRKYGDDQERMKMIGDENIKYHTDLAKSKRLEQSDNNILKTYENVTLPSGTKVDQTAIIQYLKYVFPNGIPNATGADGKPKPLNLQTQIFSQAKPELQPDGTTKYVINYGKKGEFKLIVPFNPNMSTSGRMKTDPNTGITTYEPVSPDGKKYNAWLAQYQAAWDMTAKEMSKKRGEIDSLSYNGFKDEFEITDESKKKLIPALANPLADVEDNDKKNTTVANFINENLDNVKTFAIGSKTTTGKGTSNENTKNAYVTVRFDKEVEATQAYVDPVTGKSYAAGDKIKSISFYASDGGVDSRYKEPMDPLTASIKSGIPLEMNYDKSGQFRLVQTGEGVVLDGPSMFVVTHNGKEYEKVSVSTLQLKRQVLSIQTGRNDLSSMTDAEVERQFNRIATLNTRDTIRTINQLYQKADNDLYLFDAGDTATLDKRYNKKSTK